MVSRLPEDFCVARIWLTISLVSCIWGTITLVKYKCLPLSSILTCIQLAIPMLLKATGLCTELHVLVSLCFQSYRTVSWFGEVVLILYLLRRTNIGSALQRDGPNSGVAWELWRLTRPFTRIDGSMPGAQCGFLFQTGFLARSCWVMSEYF